MPRFIVRCRRSRTWLARSPRVFWAEPHRRQQECIGHPPLAVCLGEVCQDAVRETALNLTDWIEVPGKTKVPTNLATYLLHGLEVALRPFILLL